MSPVDLAVVAGAAGPVPGSSLRNSLAAALSTCTIQVQRRISKAVVQVVDTLYPQREQFVEMGLVP